MGSLSSRSILRSARSPLHLTPSSSVDSSSSSSDPTPCLNNSTANDNHEKAKPSYLDTNLSLGLGGNLHVPRIDLFGEKRHDSPPVKPLLRSAITGRFFIKVYMEGVLIGRKLDLLAHNDYGDLVTSLSRMFNTNIQRPGESAAPDLPDKLNMLTYEDKDGDWMMVGDVPWEMFKRTVKRLMIARPDKCQGGIKFIAVRKVWAGLAIMGNPFIVRDFRVS